MRLFEKCMKINSKSCVQILKIRLNPVDEDASSLKLRDTEVLEKVEKCIVKGFFTWLSQSRPAAKTLVETGEATLNQGQVIVRVPPCKIGLALSINLLHSTTYSKTFTMMWGGS